MLVLALGTLIRLDPLAHSRALVHGLDEANWTALNITAVVLTHDWLDGLGGFVGMVERDRGDVVVEDVGLDDAVEEVTADEAKLTVDGRGRATGEVPRLASVVRERRVGVLKVGDGDWYHCQ